MSQSTQSNIVQLNLEKYTKEYYDVFNVIQQKEKEIDRNAIAKECMDKTQEEQFEIYMNKIGDLPLLKQDLYLLKLRLFYTWEAYKELVEPPTEIAQLIQEAIKDIKFELCFSVKGAEVLVVNEKLHEERHKLLKDSWLPVAENIIKTLK